MKIIRAFFVNQDLESKARTDLGLFLEKNKDEGLAWRRAFQVIGPNHLGLMPNGRIEWESL